MVRQILGRTINRNTTFFIYFFETCLVKHEQEGGNWKVIENLKKELREKGKSEEEINEIIERGH